MRRTPGRPARPGGVSRRSVPRTAGSNATASRPSARRSCPRCRSARRRPRRDRRSPLRARRPRRAPRRRPRRRPAARGTRSPSRAACAAASGDTSTVQNVRRGHAVAADRLDLARRQPGVDEHRPGAAAVRRQGEDDRRGAVLVDDQRAIAGPHAQADEQRSGLLDRLRELAIIECPAGLDQGRSIPESVRAARRELVDPARRLAAPGRGRRQGASATSRLQGA